MAGFAESRWRALRALYEGQAATAERLGAAGGLRAETIARRAARDGWVTAGAGQGQGSDDQTEADEASERARRLSAQIGWLIGEIEEIGKEAQDGAPLDKARIEAVSALTRTLEKIGEIMRLDEGANNNNKTGRDADMAGLLERIDGRIVELARGYAERLVAEESERREDGADQR